jgi:hypothetical protein
MDCTGVCRHHPCPDCEEEHRGSRMPEGVVPIDPLFIDAAFRGFEPVTPEQRAAFREKSERIWAAANGVRR